MNEQTWWYLSRASGMVAWVLLAASCLWGVLLVTRMLKPADRPAWLLDLHRWLGALAVVTTAMHLGALVADNYVHFGWREILVPQASEWRRGPVTVGVVAMYLLAAVQITSLLMRRLPRRLWRAVHVTSYGMFAAATVHGVTAGTDRSNDAYVIGGAAITGALVVAVIARVLHARARPSVRRSQPSARVERTAV